MDIMDWMQGLALFACPIIAYILCFKEGKEDRRKHGHYHITYWNFALKKWWAYLRVKRSHENKQNTTNFLPTQEEEELERPRKLVDEENVDSLSILGVDQKGNKIQLKMTHKRHRMTEVWLLVQLDNGKIYQMPNHPDTVVHNNVSHTWSVGGLKMEMCEPFRKWRISFNGLLRCGVRNKWSEDGSVDNLEHVRFSFIWSACSGPVNLQSGWSPILKSEALALEPWRDGSWWKLADELGDGYEQWGTLHGTWTSADNDAKVLYLRGLRRRLWGDDQAVWQHRRLSIVGISADGFFFSLVAFSSRHGLSHAQLGHVREQNGNQCAVTWSDISLGDVGEKRNAIPPHHVVRFSASGKFYTAVLDFVPRLEATHFGGRPWDQEIRVMPFEGAVNAHQAVGVAEFWYSFSGMYPIKEMPSTPMLRQLETSCFNSVHADARPSQLVVSFEDRECRNTAVVGGKAASLALMTSVNDNQLNIPPGFCLTVAALEEQLTQCSQLREAINTLQEISCAIQPGVLKDQCEKTVTLFESTPVCQAVATAIKKHLRLLASEQPLAVRSSGVGEDGEELSAAGQNATILGQHVEDVLTAVARCWASLYAFQSVAYRRQHGQEVLCGMGVVVQVMVPADTAGVMFTRHPFTGDPTQMLITANYGLGESVVSAMVEPDTIIVSRDGRDNLSIKEMHCGSKAQKVSMEAGGGITTTNLDSSDMGQICVSAVEALALAQLGVELEAMFGGSRDIEWAIKEGRIYLLQSRPITSLNNWSDFDLLHEMDAPITTDTEALTIANTGEVFPGALSPLSSSWILRGMDQSVVADSPGPRTNRGHCYYSCNVVQSHHHVMLNVLNTMLSNMEKKLTIDNKVSDMAIYGHLVTTPELHRLALERNGAMGLAGKISVIYGMITDSWTNTRAMKEARQIQTEFTLDGSSFTSAADLYAAIHSSFSTLYEVTRRHSQTSRVSLFSQVVAMSVLMEGKEEFTGDHISDISLLLSSCSSNIVSAEIPTAFKALCDAILASKHAAGFGSEPLSTAMHWLTEHSPEVATQLQAFLHKHAHRGIKEFDLMTETWGIKPETVIETLQTMVRATGKEQKSPPQQDSSKTANLISVQKSSTKKILKWLMSWCHASVARREDTKASLIAVVHCYRLAYRHLGQLLVNEGRIPDASLVFYFTHYELGLVLRTRDSTLIAKATRRKRLWNQWDQLRFPEIVRGIPDPTSTLQSSAETSSAVRLQGTSVSQGTVMGRACVVLKLDQITQLQSGDILITHSTDIGWSPYFPMLGGVVTELGGLISHGAVVAREYGLPCIVGAQSATSMFQTGDTVLLVGSQGTLEKIASIET